MIKFLEILKKNCVLFKSIIFILNECKILKYKNNKYILGKIK